MLYKTALHLIFVIGSICVIGTEQFTGECPSIPNIVPPNLRVTIWKAVNAARKTIAQGGLPAKAGNLPPAKQINQLEWSCDAEWNMWDSERYLNGSTYDCSSANVNPYNSWGTNAAFVLVPTSGQCGDVGIRGLTDKWLEGSNKFDSQSLKYVDPDGANFANLAQWNATEMACVHKPCSDKANTQVLYCAFSERGSRALRVIYEAASANDDYCLSGDANKQNCSGACSTEFKGLCVPNFTPPPPPLVLDYVMPNITGIQCGNDNIRTDQFVRYTALMMHNYYRRQVARGWAKDKSGSIPPAASMNELTFDCHYENMTYLLLLDNQCSDKINKAFTDDRAVLFKSFNDTSISAVDAMQQAISGWFEELNNAVIGDNPTLTSGLKSTIWNVANMIHDKNTKFACNIHYCTNVMVACQYEQPFVEVDKAIYEAGPTCSKCAGGKCGVANSFC
ncbi:hypothetical protein Q1695_016137 [Nippostrongylus brasiliensis]|nr:hypothetical protein Q1695_016137 [Nippostrongylus brasiliensis]